MMGYRQQRPRIGLTVCPDLVDHYNLPSNHGGVLGMKSLSVADVEGPWVDPNFESSLIERCRENWSVPVSKVSNYVLATFIRQRIALCLVVPEAKQRIAAGYIDDTDERLASAGRR